jgi:hypothetical protein
MHDHPGTSSPATPGHERSDVEIRPLVVAGAALAAVALVVHVVLIGVMWIFERQEQRTDLPVSPVVEPRAMPTPVLQPSANHKMTPAEDMAVMRSRDQAILSSYGWVDREQGVVRIPIEEAMQKLVAQGNSAPPTTQEVRR